MTPAGLEPAIPGSVGRCLIHWATGPIAMLSQWISSARVNSISNDHTAIWTLEPACAFPATRVGYRNFKVLTVFMARPAQSAERKALKLVVVGSSPTVGVFRRPERPFALQETRTTEAATLLAELSRRHSDQNSQDSLTEWLR